MSWAGLNNLELQTIRKSLGLDVSEAAEYIGGVSKGIWEYWEAGHHSIPDDIATDMYDLCVMRRSLVDNTIAESGDDAVGALRWYSTLDEFIVDCPNSNNLDWRLHQSALSFLFVQGGGVELSNTIDTNKKGFIYKWFNNLTDEQLEWNK